MKLPFGKYMKGTFVLIDLKVLPNSNNSQNKNCSKWKYRL